MSNTRVITGEVRLSYANIWEPKFINGSDPKYSVSLLIPKSDTATVKAIEAAIEEALQAGIGKFGGKIPPRGSLKLPLRDGDTEREDEAYAGHYFLNANSKNPPQVVDAPSHRSSTAPRSTLAATAESPPPSTPSTPTAIRA